MKRTTVCVATFLGAVLSVAAIGIGATVDMPRTLMSPADFTQLKKAVEAETRLALAGCREAVGSDRDLCKAKARAEERVKRADLGARYHGTVTALDEARTARTRASYDLAKAHCGARISEERIDCLRAARDDSNNLLNASKLASN